MRQSIYLLLAVTLIKADISNELRKKRKKYQVQRIENLYLSAYLMRDIGIQADGFAVGEKFSPAIKAQRTVRYLRYLQYDKIKT